MDNLTHTLIGVLVGETAARLAPAGGQKGLSPATRRNALVCLMAVGSNLPDLDFIYPMLTHSKLDYLSQHRGHTHTLIGGLLVALLMLAVCEAWRHWQSRSFSRNDRAWLAAAALAGPLLHVLMDAGNSYGVHPFWPFYNGWLYGDAVFIIEPLFWTAAAPLVFLLKSRLARILVALALMTGIVLSLYTKLVPPAFCAVLLVLTALMLSVGRYARPRTALLSGVGVWLGTTALFIAAHWIASARMETYARLAFSDATTLDHVLTPMPVNPLCWELLLVQTQDERYVLRRAMLALAPQWLPAARCPGRSLNVKLTAPLQPVTAAGSAELQWYGELALPRERMKQLAARYCDAAIFMRFARAPWAMLQQDHWIVGDLRYDREPELGFAELELAAEATHCSAHEPPWLPPRSDLLSMGSAKQ